MGVLTAIMLFVSVLLHELGHSPGGAANIKMAGAPASRFLSLEGSPRSGLSRPVPIAEFLIAIAGPLVSLDAGSLFSIAVQPLG